MFFPLTVQDYAIDDDGGECTPYRRRVMLPYASIQKIEELQEDDSDTERVRMFEWGARAIVELRTELIYVVEPVETIYASMR